MSTRKQYRKNGTVVIATHTTLIVGPDDEVLAALDAVPSVSALIAEALRAHVQRFETLRPDQRFRQRKDGRLVLPVALEFYPKRDAALIRAIEAAPPEAIAAAIVELMRSGGGGAVTQLESETEMLDVGGLGLDL